MRRGAAVGGHLPRVGDHRWRRWRKQQEQDTDLQPVLQWVEAQRKPPWEEVAALSRDVKELWTKFGALRLCRGVLQQAWKEPATGEERWQVVVLSMPGDSKTAWSRPTYLPRSNSRGQG